MMKKFVAFVLVLAISMLASAVPFEVVQDTTQSNLDLGNLAGGEVIWLKLTTGAFTDAFEFNVTGADAGVKMKSVWGVESPDVGFNAGLDLKLYDDETGTFTIGSLGENGIGPAGPGEIIDLVWNFYVVAPSVAGTYTLDLLTDASSRYSAIPIVAGGTWGPVTDADVVGPTLTVVPEPMTMALLGLGGLFLRRRK